MKKDDNEFKIRFDGQQHQIDAQVLVSSLIHTTTIIQEINKYFNTGKKIEIKVNALEKGSFLIHVELMETVMDSLKNLLTKENVFYASALITGFVGLIQLRHLLKGDKPKSVIHDNNITIIQNNENVTLKVDSNVYNIYENNSVVSEALSQNFDVIDNDPAIEGFEITDKFEKPFIRIDKSDFKVMSAKSEVIEDNRKCITEITRLNVVRVSFEENLKWDFYFRGNKISARITDPNFYELIDKGESFAKGDVLEVELQTNQIFDDTVRTYINKSYQVNRIIRHFKRDEQQKLEFN